jgi:hypothetical protein
LKKSKGKAFNVTQSDESNDKKSEEEVEGEVNYLAFTAHMIMIKRQLTLSYAKQS